MSGSASPAGTWSGQLHIRDEYYDVVLHFTPDGQAFILSGPDLAGAGTWTAADDSRFSYRIAHPLVDGSGTYTGWIDVDHHAVQSGDTLTSSGKSYAYGVDDQLLRVVEVTTVAKRTTTT